MAGVTRIRRSSYLTSVLALTLGFVTTVQAIDCYKCTSINGMSEDCEDEFKTDISTVQLIERKCFYGLFEGTHCIKLKGEREDGTKITVRDCSDADWGSHCGDIRYQFGDKEQMIFGCLKACHHDGCNKATTPATTFFHVLSVVALVTFLTQNIGYVSFIS